MMENAFYFILKALFVLKLFKCLPRLESFKVNFKIYDVTMWLTSNSNAHIVQYLMK